MLLHWPSELDVSSFLKHNWQTRPLLFEQAFPGFSNPLSRDELAGLALDGEVNSRIILRENDTSWHCRHGPFSVQELEQLPSRDWTLLVSDVEKHLPDMRDWLLPFHFIPQWRIDDLMISYAPTGASVGAHTDNYDVFLLQAAGRRRWSIDPDPGADKRLLPNLDIGVLANFTPRETFDLKPGDMLYLPPGIPHHGVALDDECMTWSIGFRAPSHREIVADLAENIAARIPETAFYSDPSILLHEHSGQVSSNAIARIREIWNTYVHPDNEAFEQLAGQLLTRRNIYAPGHATIDDNSAAVADPHAAKPVSVKDIPDESLQQYISALLGDTQFWERNSFNRFAFIAQLDAVDQAQNKGVLNRLRNRMAGEKSQKQEQTGDPLTELQTGSMPENTAINDNPDSFANDSAELAYESQTLTRTTATEESAPAKLFVDGQCYSCSDQLARLLTSTYHISTADFRKLLLNDTASDRADARVLGQLIETNALLPLQIRS